jgi:hypothetical protein
MVTRIISSVFLLMIAHTIWAQSDFQKDGILRATATFALGSPLASASTHAYVKGELEYYLQENWSVRGDIDVKVGDLAKKQEFTDYHSGFAGIVYHVNSTSFWDPYIGLQPGVVFAGTRTLVEPNTYVVRRGTFPVLSPVLGVNYYAKQYFHAFVNLRYIQGHRNSQLAPYDLSELRLSFGLAFHLGLKK